MSYTHNWSISKVLGHPLNGDCVYKIVANLVSTSADNSVESQHEFYLAPNILPELDPATGPSDPDISSEIVWVDSQPGFISTSELTESMIWSWIDSNEDRASLESLNEQQMPADVEIDLPFVNA